MKTRKEYSPWEFSGFAWAATRNAIESLDKGDIVKTREELERIIEQYHLLNEVNGLQSDS